MVYKSQKYADIEAHYIETPITVPSPKLNNIEPGQKLFTMCFYSKVV